MNNAPEKPNAPSGPSSGKIEESYTFSTSTTDPDEHQIKYGFDWDGNEIADEWTDLFNSSLSMNRTTIIAGPGY